MKSIIGMHPHKLLLIMNGVYCSDGSKSIIIEDLFKNK